MTFAFSPSRFAIGYIALAVMALAVFAIPLWYAWDVNIATFKAYVQGEAQQKVTDAFAREGAAGAAAAIDSMAPALPGDEIVMLADASKRRLAGNLPAWPAEVPEAAGTYGLVIGIGDGVSQRVVASHLVLPGGYHLLMGRHSARFESLVERFWYGIAAAMASVLILGAAIGWAIRRALLAEVRDITRTAAAIAAGDHSQQLDPRGRSEALDTLATTVNGMLDELARQNARLESQIDELFDLAPDALLLTDIDNLRILRINKEFTRMFGYTPEEAVGQHPVTLLVPDDAGAASFLPRDDILAGTKVEKEVVRRRKDGSYFHALVTAKRVSMEGENDATYIIYRDITERREAEDKLRRSEAFLAEGQRISHTGTWGWRVASGVVAWSDEHYRMLGFQPGTVQPSVELFLAAINPADRSRVRRQVEAAKVEKGTFAMDYRVALRDGSRRHMHSEGRPVVDPGGDVEEFIGVTTDVTERVEAEAALKLSEERYALAMEVTGDGHWDWNITEDVYYPSPIYLDMCGLPRDTIVTTRASWLALYPKHPEDYPKYEAAVQAHLAGHTSMLEMEMRILPRGEVRWLHIRGQCLRDASGRSLRWAGSVTDITGRKRVDGELRARQDMLDLAQKAAQAAAFEWWIGAPGGGENRSSADLEIMYGVEPGTYDGTFDSWKEMVHPEDRPGVDDAIRTARNTGEVSAEYRVMHASGGIRWLQAKGRMFFDEGGTPARVVGFMLDVTARRLAEDEVRHMERQLRQVQRLEAMGTLAGGIAHDFNNLLGAILGYGEMALRDVPAGTRLRRDLDSIMIAGERGRALVDRVLAFSRSGVSERVAVHVEDVVRETLHLLESHIPPGVTLETRLGAGEATILGDATQVHQVVTNLVTNALQAMPTGGTLRVSVDALRLDRALAATTGIAAPRDYVVIEVLDSGSGIPPGILEQIFDPFFTTKEVGVGSGLGLSLVHGIVTSLGGVIGVATQVGEGSVFTVYLPRGRDATGAYMQIRAVRTDARRGNGEHVLVVDDEESLETLVVETLSDLGYAPLGFTSAVAAFEVFAANPARFDAIVTDESMPGMSGSEMIRKIREMRPEIPTLVVSGYLSPAIVRRVREAGADEVLRKPASAESLATALERILHPGEAAPGARARSISRP